MGLMQILFAITVLCLLVLLWAGVAIRRHIRAAAKEREQRLNPPAIVAMEQELRNELRTQHQEKGFFGSVSDPQPARHTSRTRPAVRDSAVRASITAVPIFEPASIPQPPPQATASIAEESKPTESRKPPVSTGTGFERLDLAHYNKDMGDLSDPYQIPRTANNSGAIRNRS